MPLCMRGLLVLKTYFHAWFWELLHYLVFISLLQVVVSFVSLFSFLVNTRVEKKTKTKHLYMLEWVERKRCGSKLLGLLWGFQHCLGSLIILHISAARQVPVVVVECLCTFPMWNAVGNLRCLKKIKVIFTGLLSGRGCHLFSLSDFISEGFEM